MKMVKGRDMQSVLDILQQRAEEDPSFFYRLKFGDHNNIVSYFWRDSLMLEDFKAYEDLVIFNTTNRTKKYSLICAPFVRINCHWKTTTFGCAFVTNEKEESFEWLLQTFKRAMCQQQSKIIFTDQDKAMSNAIEKKRTLSATLDH
ncbi:Protein FAR1-RELATED SEQUENCE 5 [Bienertia sinuspersici]